MSRFCDLKPGEPVRQPDHVLVVKHDDGKFEVTGTAGADKPDARYLTPPPFEDKGHALACAQAFADAHALPLIYIKGFVVAPERV
jgi:hypothetical protein